MKFYTMPHLAVVGRNTEMADMDNPNGDIIREVHVLVAQDDQGHRWIIQNLGETIDPEQLGWTPYFPVYGSQVHDIGESKWQEKQETTMNGFDL